MPRPPRPMRHRPRHASRRLGFVSITVGVVFLLVAAGGVAAWQAGAFEGLLGHGHRQDSEAAPSAGPRPAPTIPSPLVSPTPAVHRPPPSPHPINRRFPGLTTFRGNASRTYYGRGPVP